MEKKNGFAWKKPRSKRYHKEIIIDNADDLALLPNIQTESLLRSLEKSARDIGVYVSSDKTEFKYFKENRDISILNWKSQNK